MTASALKSIEIALKANVSNFRSGIGLAAGDVQRFGQDLKKVGDTSDRDLKKIGTGAMIAGGAMLAGFGLAQKAVIGFDQQISELGAVTGEGAAGLEALRAAALKAGADTSFSASEAAQAEVELAKAGVSSADILHGALGGALNLAAAGHLELGRAAEIAASAMTVFKLSGSDVPHIADLLAAGANKSAAEVEDMGAALQQSGLVAAQLGLSIEDTSAMLAMFAQNGLKGSDAGTSLKTMLIALNPKSEEAAATMEGLGLKFYDAQGKFVGVTNMAEQLKTKLGGLTQEQRNSALMTIFGTDAIRAASIIYSEGGKGVDDWRAKVDDAGYASELAGKKLDNLGGDLEQLRGSIETTLIQGASGATGMLRGLTQGLTTFVNGLGAMPAGMQQVTYGFMGIAGGVTFLGGAIATGVPKYREMIASLTEMGPAGAKMAQGVGMGATALMVAAPGIIYATQLWGELEQHASKAYSTFTKNWKTPETFRDQSTQLNQLIGEYDRVQRIADEGEGIGGFFKEMGQNLPGFSHEISNAEAETRKYESAINDLQGPHKNWEVANAHLQATLGMTQDEVDALAKKAGIDLTGDYAKSTKAVEAFVAGLNTGTPASQELGAGLAGLSDKTKSAKDRFEDFKNTLKTFIEIAFGVGSAQDNMQSKLNQLPEKLKDVRWNFNGTSDAAIAYRDHMRGITEDASHVIEGWRQQGVTGDELKQKIELMTLSLFQQAIAYGVPRDEALKYLDPLTKIANTPDITTAVSAPGAVQAAGEIGDINHQKDLASQPTTVVINAQVDQARSKIQEVIDFARANNIDLGGAQQDFRYRLQHPSAKVFKVDPDGTTHQWWNPTTYRKGYAAGTSSMPDGRFLVGEYGPEIGEKHGSHVSIIDAGRTRRMLGPVAGGWGGPGPSITTIVQLSVPVSAPNYVGDQNQLTDAIANAVQQAPIVQKITDAVRTDALARNGRR